MGRKRVPRNSAQSSPGLSPLSPLTHRQRFQPLPAPLGQPPYHFELTTAFPDVAAAIAEAGHLVFHTVGDTGGIGNASAQAAVARAMKGDLNRPTAERPMFFYHLGDVVYFFGEPGNYYEQFYDPYDHYDIPIIAIPGNHDGDVQDSSQTSLAGWVAYFMTPEPHIDPDSHDAPRVTVSQPNVYFTLNCPFATIVGLYTNVPDGGSLDSMQVQWLAYELHSAPQDKALIVCLHHPVYSFDDHHSGSPRMADVLQHAINDSRRVPNLILSGHVHNYQRIERGLVGGSATPFLVAGDGGYFHLHGMNAEDGTADETTGARLMYSDAKRHGYLTLTIDGKEISGKFTAVDARDGTVEDQADTFAYAATPIFLPEGSVISL
jgi:hypothetical protein